MFAMNAEDEVKDDDDDEHVDNNSRSSTIS